MSSYVPTQSCDTDADEMFLLRVMINRLVPLWCPVLSVAFICKILPVNITSFLYFMGNSTCWMWQTLTGIHLQHEQPVLFIVEWGYQHRLRTWFEGAGNWWTAMTHCFVDCLQCQETLNRMKPTVWNPHEVIISVNRMNLTVLAATWIKPHNGLKVASQSNQDEGHINKGQHWLCSQPSFTKSNKK